MFIQTEATPNPATLKFIPEQPVLGQGTASFDTKESAANSPMATRLFRIEGVAGVFLGPDFVTVTKADDQDWQVLKPLILEGVMNHYNSGDAVVNEADAGEVSHAEGESDVVKQIKELLDTRVRPAVAQDGGDIIFNKFEDGVVHLTMLGSCNGCPSSTATLKHGIENMLRYYVPEVTEVRESM